MVKSASSFSTVALSTTTYGLFHWALSRSFPATSTQALTKLISASHATLTTILALYTLRSSQWEPEIPNTNQKPKFTPDGNLDDSQNPLVQTRNHLANIITAWETGYLIYDTYAMVHLSPARALYSPSNLIRTARKEPALLSHHVLLISALLYLQLYIARGRERGIWVIVAFLLMNASSPLLHARWWIRSTKRNWNILRALDAIFLLVFAAARFGTVAWVLRRYGAYHGLGPWGAYRRLRVPCQVGTGALVGLNAGWWALLVQGFIKRGLMKTKSG